jgi:hypothetical protein
MGSVSPVWFSRDTPGVHLSDSSPAAAGEGLGKAVSLSADGTTALVGAWGYGGNYTGAVYVFHETPAGWSQSAVLTNGAGAADDRFGAAVALSPDGTTALIGAWGVDSDRGAAYVFHTTSEDAWASTSTPTATLTNSAGSAEDNLGWSLGFSGDGTTAIVGSPGVYVNGGLGAPGAAYIFNASSEDAWASSSTPTATLTNGVSAVSDTGTSVALSADGTTALVGAYRADSDSGAAYVFHTNSESSWASSSAPMATLGAPASSPPGLGSAVAISADGTTGLVGACPLTTDCAGAAYIFHSSAEDSWASTAAPNATLTVPNHGGVGVALALSSDGSVALLGAPYGGNGFAAVFQTSSESSWSSSSSPTAGLEDFSNAISQGETGFAVALSSEGATALVGSPAAESTTGVAYLFGAATGLDFTSQPPTSARVGQSFSTAVSVEDALGLAIDSDNSTSIALTLTPNTGASGASLLCAANPATSVTGTASFTCSVDRTGNSYTLTATANGLSTAVSRGLDITALATKTLTITKAGAGTGAVTSLPAGIDCGTTCSHAFGGGTQVALAATPASGSRFAGWSGGGCSGTGGCQLTLGADTTVTATFAPKPKCSVPKVKGKALAAAERAIKSHNCSRGKITHATSRTIKKGHVIAQRPKPGSRLNHGAKVNLVVSKGT